MINIHQSLKEFVKDAMKAKDTVRLNVIRGLLTSFTNELVATGKTPQDVLDDANCNKVILRTIKQREDAISQFQNASRQDLVDEDTAQLNVLREFAPAMASIDEVKKIASLLKDQMGITDKSKMGMLIGSVKKELGDKGDGNVIKSVVEDLFN